MSPTGFEQFAVGQVFTSGIHLVTAADIKAFAEVFDPQAQHMDEAEAAGTLFGGLVASGWHTASLTMRLMLESSLGGVGGRSVGLGVRELKWLVPVRPGDAIRARTEIIDTRASRSRPDRGIILMRTTTRNQADAVVLDMTSSMLVPRDEITAAC